MLLNNIIKHLKSVGVITSGLVVWLDGSDFTNSPQTTTLSDRSGNNNDASASGFAYTTSSGSNGAGGIALDGTDDKLTISNALALTTWTMQFKVKIGTPTSYGRFISANSDSQFLYTDYTTKQIKTSGTAPFANFYYSDNSIYDICQVFDGLNYKLYVNGGSIASMIKNDTTPIVSAMFGNRADNSRPFKGAFYNIMLYNRALSSTEILQNHNATIIPGISIVSDGFTRSDSITTLGNAETGQTWSVDGGAVWGILSNQCYKYSGSSSNAVINAGVSNAKVTVTFSTATGYSSLIFRYTDASNFLRVNASGGTYALSKYVAGAWTVLGTSSVPPVNGDIISVQCNGTSIVGTINGVQQWSISESFNSTATSHGVRALDNASKFDNFKVESI